WRFIRDLRRAAERGVDVLLVMQGNPDRPVSVGAAAILYNDLLSMGIRIVRYTERPLHAKVAVIDDHWSTVGSSNLDPLSLGLNFEANLFILDREFNTELRQTLDALVRKSCEEVSAEEIPRKSLMRRMLLTFGYHVTRRMPTWWRHVPWHEQQIRPMEATGGADRKAGWTAWCRATRAVSATPGEPRRLLRVLRKALEFLFAVFAEPEQVRGMNGHADDPASGVERLAACFPDQDGRLQNGTRRGRSHGDHDGRLDFLHFLVQPPPALFNLPDRRFLVDAAFAAQAKAKVFDRVGDEYFLSGYTRGFERAVQHAPCRPDEWQASLVLLRSGLLADQHQGRVRRAFARYAPGRRSPQVAAAAGIHAPWMLVGDDRDGL